MSGAVHIEALVGFLLEDLVERSGEKLQVEHALREHANRRVVRLVPGIAGLHFADRRELRREHHLVGVALRRAEPAVHREAARHVRGVTVELAASVDQQQVAVAQRRIVEDVVQHAGIRPPGDDRPVRGELRAAAPELVQQLGFDLVLVASRARRLHRAPVRAGGDARRAPHHRELVRVLDQAHVVDQSAHVVHAIGGRDACARAGAHSVQPVHRPRIPVRVGAEGVEQRRRVLQQLRERLVELADRVRFVEAEALARGLGPVAVAVPDLALLVAAAAEEQRLRRASGDDHQRRVRLGEAAQVIEVAVEAVGEMRVAVTHSLRRCGNDGDSRRHGFG